MTDSIVAVRSVLQQLQEAYTQRDLSSLDEAMTLFSSDPDTELIGIGAVARGGDEWFQGPAQIRSILEGDWTYWGDVSFDVEDAKITIHEHVAWLSTTGAVTQSTYHEKAMVFYLEQMKSLLEDQDMKPDMKLVEATHFGMRRLWERQKGLGHNWPFVLTAVLIFEDDHWRFHTIHWSMPVD
jgi:hypothetical protein